MRARLEWSPNGMDEQLQDNGSATGVATQHTLRRSACGTVHSNTGNTVLQARNDYPYAQSHLMMRDHHSRRTNTSSPLRLRHSFTWDVYLAQSRRCGRTHSGLPVAPPAAHQEDSLSFIKLFPWSH